MTAFRSTGCDETPGSSGGGCGSGSAGPRSEISFRFELDEDDNEPETRSTLVGDPCGDGDASTRSASVSASAPARHTLPIAARRQLPIPRVELGPDEYNDTSVTVTIMSDGAAKDSNAQCDQSPNLNQLPPSVRTSTTAQTSGGASVKVEITDRRLVSTTGGRRLGARHAIRSSANAVATAVAADGSGGSGGESLQVPTIKRTVGGIINNQRQSLLGRPVNTTSRRCAATRRRDARYRRCQARLYNFLERPKNWRSILYHLLV
jgi:hypothetical protein